MNHQEPADKNNFYDIILNIFSIYLFLRLLAVEIRFFISYVKIA